MNLSETPMEYEFYTPNLSRKLRVSDSPKITHLTSVGSPKVRHHALGFMAAKLVKAGDFVYLDDKLCRVISKTDELITAVEKTKNNVVNYRISNPNQELRFEILHPSTYERKVKVTE